MELKAKTKSQLVSENEELSKRILDLEAAQRSNEFLERALLDSEERYRTLYESAPLGYHSLDERGNFVEVNDAWTQSLGYQREDVIGMNFTGFLAKDSREKYEKDFSEFKKTGKLSGVEYEIIKKDGSHVIMSIEGCAAYGVGGELKQTHCILNDITDKKRAQDALHKSEEKYKSYFENDISGNFISTPEGELINCNKSFLDIFGFKSVEEAKSVNMETVYTNSTSQKKMVNKIRKEKTLLNYEHNARKVTGEIIYISQNTVGEFDEKNRLILMHGNIIDITKRKEAEKKLHEQDAALRALFNATMDTIAIIGRDGKIININEEGAKRIGDKKENLIGKDVFKMFSPDLAKVMRTYNDIVIEKGKPTEYEDEREGIAFLNRAYPIFDKDGKVKSAAIFALDITQRKQEERLLKINERRLKKAQELSKIGDYEWELDSNKITWSDGLYNIFGFPTGSHITRKKLFKHIHPEDLEFNIRNMKKWLKEGGGKPYEYRIIHTDGTVRNIYEECDAVHNESGKVEKLFGIVQDITERRKAEEKHKILFETSRDAIMTLNPPSWKFNSGNASTVEMFRCKNEKDFTSRAPYELSPEYQPDGILSTDKAMEMINTAVKKGSHFFEWQHKRANGEEFPATVLLTKVEIEKGIPFLQATVRDISKQKKAEEKLKKQTHDTEERVKEINCLYGATQLIADLNNTLDSVFQGTVDLIPPSWQYPEVTCARIIFDGKVYKTSNWKKSKWMQSADIITGQRKSGVIEVSYLKKKPEIDEGPFFKEEKNLIVGLARILRDFTEHKKADEKLKLSDELNRAINEKSPIGISVRSNTGQLLDYNQSWKNIWWRADREMEDDLRTKRTKLTFIKRDNYLGNWQAKVENIYKNGGTLFIPELETKSRKKAAAKWISNYFYGIKDNKGKVDRVVILTENITERKLSEEKLRDSESRLKILFEYAPDAIFLIDEKGKFNDGNIEATNLLGYKRGELLKRKFTFIISRYSKQKAKDVFVKAISGEPTGPDEIELIRKDSRKIMVEIRTFPVVIEEQHLVLGIARDITERKRNELEIKNSREQLRNLSGHLQLIREDERGSIAREIHDDLGQSLTALKMDAGWLDKFLFKDRVKSRKKIHGMLDLIDDTIQSVQRISKELRPGILDDLGLSAAIQWQSDEFEKRTGIKCKLRIIPHEIVLDEKVSISLYRIFQESLTNVARHSKATNVKVNLTQLNSNLEMIVEDNGIGIDEKILKDPKSLGLIGIQERVYLWKGKVEINGRKGKGTIVKVNISLKK
jgi:PAS domain S-box-containing protein